MYFQHFGKKQLLFSVQLIWMIILLRPPKEICIMCMLTFSRKQWCGWTDLQFYFPGHQLFICSLSFFYICFFLCSIDVWRGYDIGHAVYSQMLRCTNFRERDGNSDRSWLMFLSGWYLTAFTLPKDMFSDLALKLFENTDSKEIMPDFNHSKWWSYALGFSQCVQRGRCRWHQSGL